MEKLFSLTFNGQQVQRNNVDAMGESGGLADDRVFAELFRMAPRNGSNVSRGILPASGQTLIAGNGATGTVLVAPFRAFVGSRTAEATDARKNHRDVRSGLSVAEGATTRSTSLALAANASGNPRWDLVYAIVTPDAEVGAARKVKSTATGVITDEIVVDYRHTTVTLAVVAGAPGASPSFPAMPADGASTYHIPLGYVRVPSGFTSGSTVANTDIAPKAPILSISKATGAVSGSTATSNHDVSSIAQAGWGTIGARHGTFLPPTMTGGETLIACVDLRVGAESHTSGQVVDSRDWRGRLFRAWVSVGQANTARLAFDPSGGGGVARVPQTLERGYGVSQNLVAHYFGQSVKDWDADGFYVVATATPAVITSMPATSDITFVIDATTGALKVLYNNAPDRVAFLWVDFSGVYENAF